MSDFVIRVATVDDVQVITDFNVRLAEETEGVSLDRETALQGVRALLSDKTRGSYYVACAGGIIGQMMHTREWSDWRNGDIWWIQSVYVHPVRLEFPILSLNPGLRQRCMAPDVWPTLSRA